MGTVTITAKIQILPSEKERELLLGTLEKFRDGCDFVSDYIYRTGCVDRYAVNAAVYHELRGRFGLRSQMAQSAVRVVVSHYCGMLTRVLDTRRKEEQYRPAVAAAKEKGVRPPRRKKGGGKRGSSERFTVAKGRNTYELDGNEWRRVRYKSLQHELVWNRDYSMVDGLFSVNTLKGRVRLPFHEGGAERLTDGTPFRYGESKLLYKGGKFYLLVSLNVIAADPEPERFADIVGIDGGLRFSAVSYDSSGRTVFFDGKPLIQKRAKYKSVRRSLQGRGTPSARRRLKKFGNRENRWMRNENHCISKALVSSHPHNTLFVIEDLRGIRNATEVVRRKDRYIQVSWAFADLQAKLQYKAELHGSRVIRTNPRYTSQRCPECGGIHKGNRDRQNHVFVCRHCGYRSNDDRVAAMNIFRNGILYAEKCRTVSKEA